MRQSAPIAQHPHATKGRARSRVRIGPAHVLRVKVELLGVYARNVRIQLSGLTASVSSASCRLSVCQRLI